jgi:hypothetical protein
MNVMVHGVPHQNWPPPPMPVFMLLTMKKMSRLVELDRKLHCLSLVVFDDHVGTHKGLQGGPAVRTTHHVPYCSR